jgi:hypothetical protein
MSNAVLILGQSGTGKSTAIRTLPPEETFIINVLDKPLPFRGSAKKYRAACKDHPNGNYYATDRATKIIELLDAIDSRRPEIKYVVLDDFGYVMTRHFMDTAMQKGYDKFSEMCVASWNVINRLKAMRPDILSFFTMHSDVKDDGVAKPKTIGKMTDEKVCIEGMVTYVFHSVIVDGAYKFATNHNTAVMAKTPMGCFPDMLIDNDLLAIANTIRSYLDEDVPQ